MLNAIFRPIEQWPGKTTASWSRRRATFRSKYAQTLDLLEKELDHLQAKDVVIQAYFDRREIRNDGWPRSSARPSAPGVVLSFYAGKASFSYPCDHLEDNLRGIALSLEALRAVDRYGVTQGHQQYEGFKRLEAPSATNLNDSAVHFVSQSAGVSYADVRNDPDGAYRLAARKLHPDTNCAAGSHDLFVQLQTHYKTLKAASAGKVN